MFNWTAFIVSFVLSFITIALIIGVAKLISGSPRRSGIASSAPKAELYWAMRHRYLREVAKRRVLTYAEEKELRDSP